LHTVSAFNSVVSSVRRGLLDAAGYKRQRFIFGSVSRWRFNSEGFYPMNIELNIWSHLGNKIRPLDSPEDQDAIEKLEPDARAALFDCIKCVDAQTVAEDRMAAGRTLVRELDAAYNAAHADEAKANPAATQADNVRAHAAASRPGYVSTPPKVNTAVRKAYRDAEQALADARAAYHIATQDLRQKELAAGVAINAWRKFVTTPNAEDVTRAYINKSAADRAERFAKTGNAEIVTPVPPQQCELERVMQARGRTKVRGAVYRPR
jgi:hypothetical protein